MRPHVVPQPPNGPSLTNFAGQIFNTWVRGSSPPGRERDTRATQDPLLVRLLADNQYVKRCPKCGETKPIDGFYRDRSRKDGRSPICRDCRTAVRVTEEGRAYQAEYREANKDRLKQAGRDNYWQNREELLERSRAYYREHAEECKTRARAWDQANPERRRELRKAWFARNPDKLKEIRRQDHDARRGARPFGDAGEYIHILRNDPCAYCGGIAEEADHIIPAGRGGDGAWDNLTASCMPCNRRKNATPLLLFLLKRTA